MANIERLTKRVKKMEEWITVHGDGETVTNYNFLLNSYRSSEQANGQLQHEKEVFMNLFAEWMTEKKLLDEWNEFIKEKDNAVQKQQTEEVSQQEQAESSEEASEAPVEETKD